MRVGGNHLAGQGWGRNLHPVRQEQLHTLHTPFAGSAVQGSHTDLYHKEHPREPAPVSYAYVVQVAGTIYVLPIIGARLLHLISKAGVRAVLQQQLRTSGLSLSRRTV